MSLFENGQYRWRETYFVLFRKARRPSAASLEKALLELGNGYRVTDVGCTDSGAFESLTVESLLDFAAMDISYISGEEVREQVTEIVAELRHEKLSQRAQAQVKALAECDARFDVYHFQRLVAEANNADDDDEFLDPGSLLQVLQTLARLCHGVGIDSQHDIMT
jgi:hypothetical protein